MTGGGMAGGTQAAGWIAQIAGDIVGANANRMIDEIMANLPQYKPVDISQSQLDAIKGNVAALPGTLDLASKVNEFQNNEWLKSLRKVIPNYDEIQKQIGTVIESKVRGEIPMGVQAQVRNASAAWAAAGGYAGSGAGRNLVARDFGRTSLDITNEGINSAESWFANTRQTTMPELFNFANMFLSAPQVFAAQSQEAMRKYESDMTYTLGKTYPGATGYWANTAKMRGDQLSGSSGGQYEWGSQSAPASYRGMSGEMAAGGPGASTNWWSEPVYISGDNGGAASQGNWYDKYE